MEVLDHLRRAPPDDRGAAALGADDRVPLDRPALERLPLDRDGARADGARRDDEPEVEDAVGFRDGARREPVDARGAVEPVRGTMTGRDDVMPLRPTVEGAERVIGCLGETVRSEEPVDLVGMSRVVTGVRLPSEGASRVVGRVRGTNGLRSTELCRPRDSISRGRSVRRESVVLSRPAPSNGDPARVDNGGSAVRRVEPVSRVIGASVAGDAERLLTAARVVGFTRRSASSGRRLSSRAMIGVRSRGAERPAS